MLGGLSLAAILATGTSFGDADVAKRAILGHLMEVFVAGLTVSALITWVSRASQAIPLRVAMAARVSLCASLLGVTVAMVRVTSADVHGPTPGAPRHLVVIVVDHMPWRYLATYDQHADWTVLDDVFAKGRVFLGVHTIAPYTHHYFGALYSGRPAATPETASEDLISALQDAGVATRWIVSHRNAMPEGSSARVSAYRGLRSSFLTSNCAWIPEFLGLDYDLVTDWPKTGNVGSDFSAKVFRRVNPLRNGTYKDALTDVLLPQLKSLSRRSGRTFTLFHMMIEPLAGGSEDSYGAEAGTPAEVATALARIGRDDNRYDPEDEPLATLMRAGVAGQMDPLGRRLQVFLSRLDKEGLADTVVAVTTDHGEMFADGRFWYGYRPDERVVRVPFVLLRSGLAPGEDRRLFSTTDITQTCLDFFGAAAKLDPAAVSLLGEHAREWVTSPHVAQRPAPRVVPRRRQSRLALRGQ